MARTKKRNKTGAGASGWKPRFLHDGVIAGTLALVVCLFASAGLLDRYIKENGSSYFAAVIAATLVDLANADRLDEGLDGLTVNPKLTIAAQAKADDMAAKSYFAHETPEGYDSWHWFEQADYDYAYAGENLAVNFSESSDVEKAWMASPTHRANIVNHNYTEVGIAVAYGAYQGRPAVFAVQMFGRPSADEIRSRSAIAQAEEAGPPLAGQAAAAAPQASAATPAPAPAPANGLSATLGETTEVVPAASVSASEDIPWWARLVAQPKELLRVAYYIIGLFIIAALFFDFELEMRWHHLRHAKKAGMLLATMSMLFIAADWLFFGEPTVAMMGHLLQ